MPDDEQEPFDERPELPERERITMLMLESAQQQHLKDFIEFDLRPDTLKEFSAMRRQATFDHMIALNEIAMEKIDEYRIHPDFNKYFKTLTDKKDEPKKKLMDDKWHGFLMQDWKDAFTKLMRKDGQYQPRVALLIEILKDACEKYEGYIFSSMPSQTKEGIPSFGKGRTRMAYELSIQGKSNKDIADELGIKEKDVAQYVKMGAKSAKKKEAGSEPANSEPSGKKKEEPQEAAAQ